MVASILEETVCSTESAKSRQHDSVTYESQMV